MFRKKEMAPSSGSQGSNQQEENSEYSALFLLVA
jgi:hypothetical protein